MEFTYEGLDALAEAVRSNDLIETIDLSANDLKDEFGSLVAKFIQSQSELRDTLKWYSSLRGS